MIVAEGDKVVLRRIERGDLAAASAHLFTLSIVEPLTDLARLTQVFEATGCWGQDAGSVAIVVRAGGRMVGTMQFYRSAPCIHGYELGYILHDVDDRGKGYAAQATRLLTAWLWAQRPACHRLQLLIDVDNEPSWRLAEACGYEREGVLRKTGFDQDDPEDCYVYAQVRGS
jgi:RimJ/RimL family protein N-acetyltransferase